MTNLTCWEREGPLKLCSNSREDYHIRSEQLTPKQGPDLRYLRQAIWKGRDFFLFKDIDSDFGCCYKQFWNFKRTTEFWNFVRTTKFWNFVRTTEFWLFSRSWVFGLLALKMALKVNSENKFEIYGLCSLCYRGFICSKALHRLSVTFVEKMSNSQLLYLRSRR